MPGKQFPNGNRITGLNKKLNTIFNFKWRSYNTCQRFHQHPINSETLRHAPYRMGVVSGCANGLELVSSPQKEINAWKEKDPINLFREKLLNMKILTQSDVERIDKEMTQEVEEAEKFAWEESCIIRML